MTRRHFASLLGSVVFVPLMKISRDPTLAFTNGGIVRGPKLAMIGEHGSETIVPIAPSRISELVDELHVHSTAFAKNMLLVTDHVKRYGLV